MTYGWIWIGVIIAAVVVELFTDQLVSLWFAPAAAVATILDFFAIDVIWQILTFLVLAAICIVVARIILKRTRPASDSKTNIDAIIGERCVVTERIDNYAGCGQARVNGQIWSARGAFETDVFEVGEVLSVVAIEGVKLICKK